MDQSQYIYWAGSKIIAARPRINHKNLEKAVRLVMVEALEQYATINEAICLMAQETVQ